MSFYKIITIVVFVIFKLLPIQLISEEKRIFLIVIHYMDGLANTSVPHDCTTFWYSAQDTILLDTTFYPQVASLLEELKQYQDTVDVSFCDIRLSAVIMYSDKTFDLICMEGGLYNYACVKFNGKTVGPFPELVWLFFNLVYDINLPLYREMLFGIKDD
jgi:hypothetical protein